MRRQKYPVRLDEEERERLQQLIRAGKSRARVMARARIVLKSDEGWNAARVAEALDKCTLTSVREGNLFAPT